MIKLKKIKRNNPNFLELMKIHYSNPKGFVGRNICYLIYFDSDLYGAIVGGSATLHLPNRDEFFSIVKGQLHFIVNNIFYHVHRNKNKYPIRNFTVKILLEFEKRIMIDWYNKYLDKLVGIESLVELPRTGEVYKRAGYTCIGTTIGYTCKRVDGKGTDSWSGKRVWNTKELRPKLVFVKKLNFNTCDKKKLTQTIF